MVINVDIGSILPYFIATVLEIFGKDTITQEIRASLEKHIHDATYAASWVQCIGMSHPIHIKDIYQPTKIETISGLRETQRGQLLDVIDLLSIGNNAIIFGGPGEGKTILTHWTYLQLVTHKKYIPMLFPLRWPNGVYDLSCFVERLTSRKLKKITKNRRIILIVDGYDEVSKEDRRKVSSVLRSFSALNLGNFYLTCRSFYNVIELPGPRYQLCKFNPEDSQEYIKAFSKAYGVTVDTESLVSELKQHGFYSFLTHPLMLALVCILKSGPMPSLPSTPIRLIKRAIDTLTFRWDEEKGIYRDSELYLDGDDRIECLKHIAFNFRGHYMRESEIIPIVINQQRLLQTQEIKIRKLLIEIAQWYGIFIPVGEGTWGFVHNTIRDYLAASYWVNSGTFNSHNIKEWNARAAYAACFVPDATDIIVESLKNSNSLYFFSECLYNRARIRTTEIAEAVIYHVNNHLTNFRRAFDTERMITEIKEDFFKLVSDDLLYSLLMSGIKNRGRSGDIIISFSLAEMQKRNMKLSPQVINQLRIAFPIPNLTFEVRRSTEVFRFQISDLVQKYPKNPLIT